MEKNQGITLIALVITIIVLIILAGVSISIIGNSGVTKQSQNAKIMTELSAINEGIELYKNGKGIEQKSFDGINDSILVKDNIAKSVEVEDTSRVVGVVQNMEALKIDNKLGNNGKNFNKDKISNIYELDDVYVKDFTDGTLYYIKDRNLYSIKGNTTITEETEKDGKLYFDLSKDDTNGEVYSLIIAKVNVGGKIDLKPYDEFAMEKMNGKSDKELEAIFLDGFNFLAYEKEQTVDTPFKTVQEAYEWLYKNGSTKKLCTNLEELRVNFGGNSVEEMLMYNFLVYPKEYFAKYQEVYDKYNINITKPDGSVENINLLNTNNIEYPVTENGIYEFTAEFNDQIIKKSIEINSINKEEMDIPKDGKNGYKIQTIEDLVALSINTNRGHNYEGKTIKLTRDLDFADDKCYRNPNDKKTFGDYNKDGVVEGIKNELISGTGFIPIGSRYISRLDVKYDFKGIFEGNNYEIKNLNINNNEAGTLGLFGINHGEIRNIVVSGKIKIDSDSYKEVGGIVGYNYGIIKNAKNQVEFDFKKLVGYAGGIAGENDGGIIEACCNVKDIESENVNGYGGISGYHMGEAEIKDCYNIGNINIDTAICIGGIVGDSINITATVNRCYNTGNINSTTRVAYVGGIKGCSGESGIVVNSYNLGNITTKQVTGAGGIIGYHKWGVIGNCYNRGNIKVNGQDPETYVDLVGGIAGDQTVGCRIINCYNVGTVDVTAKKANPPGVGGISGIDYWALLKNTVNFGTVKVDLVNNSRVGGIAGTSYNNNENYIENNKYLKGTWTKGSGNRQDTEGILETCTLDYISDMVNVLNVDQPVIGDYTLPESVKFNKWKIVQGVNDGYPILEWQGGTNE